MFAVSSATAGGGNRNAPAPSFDSTVSTGCVLKEDIMNDHARNHVKAAITTAVLLMPLILGLNTAMRADFPTPATATASAGVSAGQVVA